jgi:hypothetical protein
MKLDRFLDQGKHFRLGFASRDAPRPIRHKSTVTGWTFFNNDHVAHGITHAQILRLTLKNTQACIHWHEAGAVFRDR